MKIGVLALQMTMTIVYYILTIFRTILSFNYMSFSPHFELFCFGAKIHEMENIIVIGEKI